MKNSILFILNLSLFCGCNLQSPVEKDVFGSWISKDGVTLKFYEDYAFEVTNMKENDLIFMDQPLLSDKKEYFYAKGHWEMVNSQGWKIIYLGFEYDSAEIKNVSTEVRITGKKLLGYKPPWYIFTWIGDPDQENRYIFEKVE